MLIKLLHNVSVNSKPYHPPRANPWGIFLKGRIPHPSGTKTERNPDPWSRNNSAKTPPHGQLFAKLQQKKHKNEKTQLKCKYV